MGKRQVEVGLNVNVNKGAFKANAVRSQMHTIKTGGGPLKTQFPAPFPIKLDLLPHIPWGSNLFPLPL